MKRLYRLRQMANPTPVVQEQLELEKQIKQCDDKGKLAYLKKKLKRVIKAAEKSGL